MGLLASCEAAQFYMPCASRVTHGYRDSDGAAAVLSGEGDDGLQGQSASRQSEEQRSGDYRAAKAGAAGTLAAIPSSDRRVAGTARTVPAEPLTDRLRAIKTGGHSQ